MHDGLGAVAAGLEGGASGPGVRFRVEDFGLIVGFELRGFAADDDDLAVERDGGGPGPLGGDVGGGGKGTPAAGFEIVHVHLGDGGFEHFADASGGVAAPGEDELAAHHRGADVVAGAGGVGEAVPLVGFGVELVEPGHVAVPVAVDDAAHHVDFVLVHDHARRAAQAVGGDGGAFAPLAPLGVVDVDDRQGRFVGVRAFEGPQHVDFAPVGDGLEVVHLDGRRGEFAPEERLEVEGFEGPRAPPADGVEVVADEGGGVFVAGGGFVLGLDGLPGLSLGGGGQQEQRDELKFHGQRVAEIIFQKKKRGGNYCFWGANDASQAG